MNIDKDLGICIKDKNSKVLSQNEICVSHCGNLVGEVCNKGCMSNYNCDAPLPLNNGMKLIKNAKTDKGNVDAVIINNAETITTLLYDLKPREELIENDLQDLEQYRLTKTEKIILQLILNGQTKKEITKSLYISEATIKTHLNNIYKKLPEKWQLLKLRNG